jgi:hypothetical protein
MATEGEDIVKQVTGRELYALYIQANAEQGIGVDTWDEMDNSDKDVWRRLAILLMEDET